jgi:hypothetical protein
MLSRTTTAGRGHRHRELHKDHKEDRRKGILCVLRRNRRRDILRQMNHQA